jgi:predicted nucleic acid-binding protein
MILVDASVIIEYLRTPSPNLLAAMQAGDAVICGATRAEILAGARHALQRQRLTLLLDSLGQVAIDDALWDEVGDHLATLRRAGVTVPFPDAILSTLAISLDIELWSRDRHFPLIQQVVPTLKLYLETA